MDYEPRTQNHQTKWQPPGFLRRFPPRAPAPNLTPET